MVYIKGKYNPKYMWIALQVERPVLLVGETGTSKTAIITNYLHGLPADKYVSIFCNLRTYVDFDDKSILCNLNYLLLVLTGLLFYFVGKIKIGFYVF